MRNPRNPDTIVGYVKVSGAAIVGGRGTGFSVSRNATGVYDIQLPPGYILISAIAQANAGSPVANITDGLPRVGIFTSTTGAAVDQSFSFVAARF